MLEVLVPFLIGKTETPWVANFRISRKKVVLEAQRLMWNQILIGAACISFALILLWGVAMGIARPVEKMNIELKRLDRLKNEFLANTTHELLTPLNGIIGIAESRLDGAADPLNEKQKYNLTLLAGGGTRLTNLVHDILDFSRLRHGDLELQLQPVNIRAMADMVLDISLPLLKSKPVSLAKRHHYR